MFSGIGNQLGKAMASAQITNLVPEVARQLKPVLNTKAANNTTPTESMSTDNKPLYGKDTCSMRVQDGDATMKFSTLHCNRTETETSNAKFPGKGYVLGGILQNKSLISDDLNNKVGLANKLCTNKTVQNPDVDRPGIKSGWKGSCADRGLSGFANRSANPSISIVNSMPKSHLSKTKISDFDSSWNAVKRLKSGRLQEDSYTKDDSFENSASSNTCISNVQNRKETNNRLNKYSENSSFVADNIHTFNPGRFTTLGTTVKNRGSSTLTMTMKDKQVPELGNKNCEDKLSHKKRPTPYNIPITPIKQTTLDRFFESPPKIQVPTAENASVSTASANLGDISIHTVDSDVLPVGDTVQCCPVCNVPVLLPLINQHLDECLQ